MSDFLPEPFDHGELRASDLSASLFDRLGAQAAGTFAENPTTMLAKLTTRSMAAAGNMNPIGTAGEVDAFGGLPLEQHQAAIDAARAAVPDVSIEDARKRVREEGLAEDLKLPEQPSIKAPILEGLVADARARRERAAAIARGPQGFIPGALGLVTSLGVGMVDPIGDAAFAVPVVGEARWARLMAGAGESLLRRAAVRSAQGAVQGAAGTTVLQPLDWWLHTQDGQDYTFADALKSVAMGAGMGAAFHAGGGGIGDVYRRLRGEPLKGSPEDLLRQGLMTGTHVRAGELEGAPPELAAEEVPGIGAPAVHPAEVLADLPAAARQDVVQSAVADVIADRQVRGAEILDIAADHEPRIAESFEAWHGSPHEFDAFDGRHIGTGEGALSYGRGLYFAQNERVAQSYRDALGTATVEGKRYDPHNPLHVASAQLEEAGSREAAIRAVESRVKDDTDPEQFLSRVLTHLKSGRDIPPVEIAGNIYKVRIKADIDHFLDWDKPLSGKAAEVARAHFDAEQARKREFHRQMGAASPWRSEEEAVAGFRPPETVEKFIQQAGPERATEMLREAGIPGIKYLDQGSRVDGEGSRNFVVFDHKHLEVISRNGEPVPQAALPPRLHALSAEATRWPDLPQGARIEGSGDNGPVVRGLEGRWQEAVDWLRKAQTGDAIGVLEHPDVPGRIDVVWGGRRYGLAHIDDKHAGDAEQLPKLWDGLRVVRSSDKFIELESPQAVAVVARDYAGASKDWLLTFFQRREEARPAEETFRGPGDRGAAAQSSAPPSQPKVGSESSGRNGRLAAAAEDPRWRALADVPEAHNDPQAIAESRAAEAVPEPKSVERSVSAVEKAAADTEEAWRQAEASYTEEERKVVNDALEKVEQDRAALEQIIADGAACLAAAGLGE